MGGKPADIDLLYGLEPVIEPGDAAGAQGLEPFVDITCPYCGETLTARLDLSGGSQSYVEDCQVCCQPMQMSIRVADDGTLEGMTIERLDQ